MQFFLLKSTGSLWGIYEMQSSLLAKEALADAANLKY